MFNRKPAQIKINLHDLLHDAQNDAKHYEDRSQNTVDPYLSRYYSDQALVWRAFTRFLATLQGKDQRTMRAALTDYSESMYDQAVTGKHGKNAALGAVTRKIVYYI